MSLENICCVKFYMLKVLLNMKQKSIGRMVYHLKNLVYLKEMLMN